MSLSTAEAELTAMLEGAVALLGSEALLRDLAYEKQNKAIYVDSTSALALSEGSGSWRTRHLRVKAEWLCEKLNEGEFAVHHCEGRVQLADLLTKAMPWSRIRELLLLWGFNICEEPDGNGRRVRPMPSFSNAAAAATTTQAQQQPELLQF